MVELSRLENHILALVGRWEPTTAYFVRKSLAETLATNISDSPGSVYPVIERLKAHGLVSAMPAMQGKRPSEQLSCTAAGNAAVREWLTLVSPNELLPEDPWRTKIRFAQALPKDDLRIWLSSLKQAVKTTAERLDRLDPEEHETLRCLEIEHARLANAARLAWVNAAMVTLLD